MPKLQGVQESGDLKDGNWLRKIAMTVNGLLLGRSNNVFPLTLTASATTTTITDPRISPDTIAVLVPTTAAGLTAFTAGIRQASAVGSIVLTHASNASTTQSFRYALVG
jgi:hypothetical protein